MFVLVDQQTTPDVSGQKHACECYISMRSLNIYFIQCKRDIDDIVEYNKGKSNIFVDFYLKVYFWNWYDIDK